MFITLDVEELFAANEVRDGVPFPIPALSVLSCELVSLGLCNINRFDHPVVPLQPGVNVHNLHVDHLRGQCKCWLDYPRLIGKSRSKILAISWTPKLNSILVEDIDLELCFVLTIFVNDFEIEVFCNDPLRVPDADMMIKVTILSVMIVGDIIHHAIVYEHLTSHLISFRNFDF